MTEQTKFKPVRKAVFRWALAWAQEAASIREDVFFSALAGWPLARRVSLEIGRRLSLRGELDSADDVFFLTWPELQEATSSRSYGRYRRAVAERRMESPGTTIGVPVICLGNLTVGGRIVPLRKIPAEC